MVQRPLLQWKVILLKSDDNTVSGLLGTQFQEKTQQFLNVIFQCCDEWKKKHCFTVEAEISEVCSVCQNLAKASYLATYHRNRAKVINYVGLILQRAANTTRIPLAWLSVVSVLSWCKCFAYLLCITQQSCEKESIEFSLVQKCMITILVLLKLHSGKTLVHMTHETCVKMCCIILTHHGCMMPAPHWGWSRHCWWPRCSGRRTSWAASTSAWWLWTWCWGRGPPQLSPAPIHVYAPCLPAGNSTQQQDTIC